MLPVAPIATHPRITGAAVLLAAALVSLPAHAGGFGPDAGRFQFFSFGDIALNNSDPDGGMAAVNDVTANGVSVGSALDPDVDDLIVAGHDVTLSNGTFQNGRIVVGGTASIAGNATLRDAFVEETTPAIDFVGIGRTLGTLSDTLADTPATGETFVYSWGGIELRGLVDGLNVFNITQTQYQASNGIAIPDFDPTRDTVVINVTGENVVRGSNGSLFVGQLNARTTYQRLADRGDFTRHQRLLWNFYEADTLISNGSIHGAILAPHAALTHLNGQLVGQVIAGEIDLRNTGRMALAQFTGDVLPKAVASIGYD